jgi:hypothetical protein
MIALAGCTDSINIEASSNNNNSEGDSASQPDIDTARFSFEYDADTQRTTIEFTGGASITAGNLRIQQDGGKEVLWPELGSTTAGSGEQIETGATAELGPNILNWGVPINSDDIIRLIYIGKDAPATLERFTPPESTNTTTTLPASIKGFSIANPSGQQLRITFDSSKRLSTIRSDINGPESTTLTEDEFVTNSTSSGSYTYEATYEAQSDGEYSATLTEATDVDGNNVATGVEVSIIIETESQTGDKFSIEMVTNGEVQFSETANIDNVPTELPDLIVGTRKSGESGCAESTYEAKITDMTINDGSETYNITDEVPLQKFSRDDRKKEVYSNPASGSDTWTWSFNIEPFGPDIPYPGHWHCQARLHIRLTGYQGERWDRDNWEDKPGTINYEIGRQQPGDSDESGTLRHGVSVLGNDDTTFEHLWGNVKDASNPERYDWYQEDTKWNIRISRK